MSERIELLAQKTRLVCLQIEQRLMPASELPGLIRYTYRVVRDLEQSAFQAGAGDMASRAPAVDPRKSIFPSHVICLDCGRPFKALRRHCMLTHGLSVPKYLKRWQLPPDYPVVAPEFSAQRAEIARGIGLGGDRAKKRSSI